MLVYSVTQIFIYKIKFSNSQVSVVVTWFLFKLDIFM